jgi:hypothetical protein
LSGRALAPSLTANNSVGYFNVIASSPGVPSIELGPFVNGAGTATTFERAGGTSTTNPFGESVTFNAKTRSSGSPHQPPAIFRAPLVLLCCVPMQSRYLGKLLNSTLYPTGPCATCNDLTLGFSLTTHDLPFGTHQLSVAYQGGPYDNSASAGTTQITTPQFTGPNGERSSQHRRNQWSERE